MLADINTSIGLLSGLINTYLNIKKQHVEPLRIGYAENKALLASANTDTGPDSIALVFNLKKYYCPELHFDLPLDRIFTLTDRFPKIVPILMHAKRSMGEIPWACGLWNNMADKMESLPHEVAQQLLLRSLSPGRESDTTYTDALAILKNSVDDGLFFSDLSIKLLSEMGKKYLPPWLRGKVAKIVITSEEHKALMPPENYRTDWK